MLKNCPTPQRGSRRQPEDDEVVRSCAAHFVFFFFYNGKNDKIADNRGLGQVSSVRIYTKNSITYSTLIKYYHRHC